MDNDRNVLLVTGGHNILGLDACSLQSHDECEPADCEVARLHELREEVTSGQIHVAVATSISGLVVSSIVALAVLGVWVFHAVNGTPMPDIPLIIITMAGAPFAAGVITTLKIPKKARVVLEDKSHEKDS